MLLKLLFHSIYITTKSVCQADISVIGLPVTFDITVALKVCFY